MQYKIPVHIENEDKIFLNLSLRQMIIIMAFWAVGYSIFKSIEPQVWATVALVPFWVFTLLGFVIAVFKNSEMTFMPFILNLLRSQINSGSRTWGKWVDSFSNIEIGYVKASDIVDRKKWESRKSHEVYESVEEKIKRL